MKTAISVPNEVFQAAEVLARQKRLSRSALYSQAVAEFLEHHRPAEVTAQLNQVYAQQGSAVDPVLSRLQVSSIPKEEW